MNIRKNISVLATASILLLGTYQLAYSVSYELVEGGGAPNTAPRVSNVSVTVSDTPTTITLTGADDEGNPLTFSVDTTGMGYGTLTGTSPSYIYTITTTDRPVDRIDTFTYTAFDGSLRSDPATVTVTIPRIVTGGVVEQFIETVRRRSRGGGGGGGSKKTTTTLVVVTPVVPVVTAPTVVTRTIAVGSKGEEVRNLQKMLNASGFRVAATGAGSPGKETTTFGAGTRAALLAYQKAKGLPQTGIYVVTGTVPVVAPVVTPTTRIVFTRDLRVGASGADVKRLQQILNAQGYTIATIGAGSPGNESTYFGAKTAAALAKLQKAKGLPVVGWVGPKTRTFLNSI